MVGDSAQRGEHLTRKRLPREHAQHAQYLAVVHERLSAEADDRLSLRPCRVSDPRRVLPHIFNADGLSRLRNAADFELADGDASKLAVESRPIRGRIHTRFSLANAEVQARNVLLALLSHRTNRANVAVANQPNPRERDIGKLGEALDEPIEQRCQMPLPSELQEQTLHELQRQAKARFDHGGRVVETGRTSNAPGPATQKRARTPR